MKTIKIMLVSFALVFGIATATSASDGDQHKTGKACCAEKKDGKSCTDKKDAKCEKKEGEECKKDCCKKDEEKKGVASISCCDSDSDCCFPGSPCCDEKC